MANWLERIREQERIRQERIREVEEERRRLIDKSTRIKDEELQKERIRGQEVTSAFDSIGVKRMLEEINRDLWANKGIVKVLKSDVHFSRELILSFDYEQRYSHNYGRSVDGNPNAGTTGTDFVYYLSRSSNLSVGVGGGGGGRYVLLISDNDATFKSLKPAGDLYKRLPLGIRDDIKFDRYPYQSNYTPSTIEYELPQEIDVDVMKGFIDVALLASTLDRRAEQRLPVQLETLLGRPIVR